MRPSPGVRYIFSTVVPVLCIPPITTYAVLTSLSILDTPFKIQLSRTALIVACAASLPVYTWFRIGLAILLETTRASQLNLRLVPQYKRRLPGGLEILFMQMSSRQKKYLGEMWIPIVNKHGTTFSIRILNDYRLCTMNPLNIQRILATDFDNYTKGKFFNDITSAMLGEGVFNSDGDLWQFHRKIIRPFFTKDRVSDLRLYEREADLALAKMQERLDTGAPVDLQDLAGRFTLDAASEFLLGTSVHALNAPLPYPHNHPLSDSVTSNSSEFATAFARAQVVLLDRIERAPFAPLFEMTEDAIAKPMKEILKFVDPIVRNALAQKRRKMQRPETKKADTVEEEEDTFLVHLLESTDGKRQKNVSGFDLFGKAAALDMKLVVDEILNILVAGRDTTSSLITSAVYFLALHPEILARLRQEIESVLGNNQLNYNILRDLKYLRAFLNETLRLVPPVPFNIRESKEETFIFDDEGNKLYVPKNTRVIMSIISMQRHEPYWGPDAHLFDPDRWLDSRVQRYVSNPFIFVPFNAGPRICLGQQFAYTEASIFLVKLILRYDRICLESEAQPPHTRPPPEWRDSSVVKEYGQTRLPIERVLHRAHLTTYVDGGLWISAKEVES